MGRKVQKKANKSCEEIQNEIDVVEAQYQKEREKAFLDLITRIIVDLTLKEYYAENPPNDSGNDW